MNDKKTHNRVQSTKILVKNDVVFESKNNGLHLIVRSNAGKIDFYPSTGKYVRRIDKKRGRGVFNLLDMLKNNTVDGDDGCDVCGQLPYLESTGMCAVCTFGEADAQVEMLSGEMEGVVWEREAVNDVCPFKMQDRDRAADTLKKMGVEFKEHNNGMQLNIKTHNGIVSYYPTTKKVVYKGSIKGSSLPLGDDINGSYGLVALIKKFGFDKKG